MLHRFLGLTFCVLIGLSPSVSYVGCSTATLDRGKSSDPLPRPEESDDVAFGRCISKDALADIQCSVRFVGFS
jgi:hypothetical protein